MTTTLTNKPDFLTQENITKLTKDENLREKPENLCNGDHTQRMLAIRDSMDVLGGKWRIPIVGALSFGGKMRFTDLLRSIPGIGAKMLSKELQDLEANQLLTRTVKQTKPITVEYEMTPYGLTLNNVICEIVSWGVSHREKIMKPTDQ
jgi:DNA-binding HxlR family transcriptional regulator